MHILFDDALIIEYDNALEFKRLIGVVPMIDMVLYLSKSESLHLLKTIRACLKEKSVQRDYDTKRYNISIMSHGDKSFSINVLEHNTKGDKSLGLFKYDRYISNKSVMYGIAAIIQGMKKLNI